MSKITAVEVKGYRNEFSDHIYPTEEAAQEAYNRRMIDEFYHFATESFKKTYGITPHNCNFYDKITHCKTLEELGEHRGNVDILFTAREQILEHAKL